MWRGGSIRSSVETIVPGPAFQRNSEPGASGPVNDIDLTSGFQFGQFSNRVSTSQTTWGGASMSISALLRTGAFPFGATTRSQARGSVTRVLGDERRHVADLLLAQPAGEGRHAAPARLDLRANGLEPRPQIVEVGADLARSRRRGEGVTRAAIGLLEDRCSGRRPGRGRDRRGLSSRRGGFLAVEPERARVPDGDQHREQQPTGDRQHEPRKSVQPDDRHLYREGSVDGAAKQRKREAP